MTPDPDMREVSMSEPTTEAGRRLLDKEAPAPERADPTEEWVADAWAFRNELALAITSIEAEAAGLDVERLARAMHNGWEGETCPDPKCPDLARWRRDAANLAREYAALPVSPAAPE